MSSEASKFSQYIFELLQRHECVIMPQFGGFVLNYSPASFSNNQLLPPSRRLSFNRSIRTNDGLLVSYISSKEFKSYADSLSNVNDVAAEWNEKLRTEKVLSLPQIGIIRQSEDQRWIFNPSELSFSSPKSFGLSTIHIKTVEETAETVIPRIDEKLRKIDPARKRSFAGRLATIASAAVLAAFFWFSSSPHLKESSLAKTIPVDKVFTTDQTQQVSLGAIADDLKFDTEAKTKEETQLSNFYIIGGSFSKQKNAVKFVEELKSKGFKAQMLSNENGFYRVAYLTDHDSVSADQKLQQIKSSENKYAWLLKW